MDARTAAITSGDSINGLGSHFMIDMSTYARGGELGYDGLDFYVAGRGGVLGAVPSETVIEAFVYFEPVRVDEAWTRALADHTPDEAARSFAECAATWAEASLPDGIDYLRLAELTGK